MRFQIHSRVLLLCIVFVAAFSALSVRLVYLQVVLHEENAKEALRKQVDIRLKPVLRTSDFAGFDLDDAFAIVESFAKPFLST